MKKEIIKNIQNDENLKKILSLYNNSSTSCNEYLIENNDNNGFTNLIYVITVNNNIIDVIVPIFSTKKTITWDYNYLDKVNYILDKKYNIKVDSKKIKTVLFFYDNTDVYFTSIFNLTDFLKYGNKGKNGNSVYFWNELLPNNNSLNKKDIERDFFIKMLPYMSNVQLKEYCENKAKNVVDLYTDINNRDKSTIIKNISDGMYIEFMMYLDLKKKYDVELYLSDVDDGGIDIILNIDNISINIDVKSSSTSDLKINRLRNMTDVYAVCLNKNTKKGYKFVGFLYKYHFWESEIHNTKKPAYNEKTQLYYKSINDIKKDLTLDIKDIVEIMKIQNKQKSLFNI